MTIASISASSVTSNSALLLAKLEANGLTVGKATLVQSELAEAKKSVAASGISAGTPGAVSVRAALDARIDADVSSGKLSKSDALAVKKTLDDIDSQTSGSTSNSQTAAASTQVDSSAAAGGGAPAGGGGSASTEKTVLSETITVTGSTKTTVTAYTDGTSTTTTTTATSADEARYGNDNASDTCTKDTDRDAASVAAKNYLSTIEPGSLINRTI